MPHATSWTDADDQLLGARPDAQIALLLGLSHLAVSRHRQRLGIPARRRVRGAGTFPGRG